MDRIIKLFAVIDGSYTHKMVSKHEVTLEGVTVHYVLGRMVSKKFVPSTLVGGRSEAIQGVRRDEMLANAVTNNSRPAGLDPRDVRVADIDSFLALDQELIDAKVAAKVAAQEAENAAVLATQAAAKEAEAAQERADEMSRLAAEAQAKADALAAAAV
jgi:hypothetical protein